MKSESPLKVAIVGASGHTGLELFRLLPRHPKVEIAAVTSERYADQPVAEAFPSFQGLSNLVYQRLDVEKVAEQADLIFTALPHRVSMQKVPYFVEQGKVVIDLSADFRLKSASVYANWYGREHRHPELLEQAVYGLPEIYREAIRKASLIANPGCYPTSSLLALAPLMKRKGIDLDSVVIDSKSGVSGGGRSVAEEKQFIAVNEDLKAYKVASHRHIPEIEQELSALASSGIRVCFTPHLIPINRGILTTAYVRLSEPMTPQEVHGEYEAFYTSEPFVRVLPLGRFPQTAHVRGTNFCDIGIAVDERTESLIVISAIDNLVKGASGQAIQNMNLRFGWPETEGLGDLPLLP